MSAQKVFQSLKENYQKTGDIRLPTRVVLYWSQQGFTADEITEGVHMFDEYLDEQRKEAG